MMHIRKCNSSSIKSLLASVLFAAQISAYGGKKDGINTSILLDRNIRESVRNKHLKNANNACEVPPAIVSL